MFPKIKSRPKSNVGSQQCSILNKIGKGINSKENEIRSLTEADFKEKTFIYKKKSSEW